jgi:hypothetical protein
MGFQLFDVLFNFLSRKTDFYIGGGAEAAEKMVITAFKKHQGSALEKAEQERKRKEADERRLAERRAAAKAKEEAEFATAGSEPKIRELTDEEAAAFDAKANAPVIDAQVRVVAEYYLFLPIPSV